MRNPTDQSSEEGFEHHPPDYTTVAERSADERTQRRLQREAVRPVGISLAGTRSLHRVAERISEDPSFSKGAQRAAAELLHRSPEEAKNINREGFPEWKAFTLSEGDKESQ